MALKDLQLKLWKQSAKQDSAVKRKSNVADTDTRIAKNIIDKLYGHVNRCIHEDKSDVKLNLFEKAAISSGMNRMLPSTKTYIEGMMHEDIKLLLGDMLGCYTAEMLEEELNKKKIKK